MAGTVQINEAAQLRYVRERLELWSEYLIQHQENGHAWPSQVAWASMMVQSSGYRSITLIPVTYDDFREIDELVTQLPRMLLDVVVSEWCWSGRQEDKARRRGITRETYRNRLKWAYCDLMRMGL